LTPKLIQEFLKQTTSTPFEEHLRVWQAMHQSGPESVAAALIKADDWIEWIIDLSPL
jgi:hypothetical protein